MSVLPRTRSSPFYQVSNTVSTYLLMDVPIVIVSIMIDKLGRSLEIKEVVLHGSSESWGYCVISMKKRKSDDPKAA